jgi:hypothetical protein
MDERKTSGVTEPKAEQPVQSDGRAMLEQAFARGSGHIGDAPAVPSERTEHSVMEGLPPAKAERIAAMRRELAELQRQLIDAQQRIATELQGRADDAERFEALEARAQAQDVKAQQDATRITELETQIATLRAQLSSVTTTGEELRRDLASRDTELEDARRQHRSATEQLEAQSSSLSEAKALVETRTAELATRTAEREAEQAAKSRLEQELEDRRKQHADVTSQLEAQFASLRDAKALIATRDAELAALTSERDALKDGVAAARAKVREVADQLAHFGGDPIETVGATSEANGAGVARSADRPKPPPLPQPRAADISTPKVETILELTEEPKSKSRGALMLIGGVILGCVATIAFVKWTSGSSAATLDDRQDLGAAPPSAPASEHAVVEPTTPVEQPVAVSDTPSTQPPSSENDENVRPDPEIESRATAPAEIMTDGVIVLPPEAADHRVYVDGRVVRVKNSRAVVACGAREIRIGSRGARRTVDVACGAETAVPGNTSDR